MTLINEEITDNGFIYLVPKVDDNFKGSKLDNHIEKFIRNACKGLDFKEPNKKEMQAFKKLFYDKFEDELVSLFLLDPCNSNNAEYLFYLLENEEHEVITNSESAVWLTMQKMDVFWAPTEENRVIDFLSRIQDNDMRLAVFGSVKALNSLRAKHKELTVQKCDNLMKMAQERRDFTRALEGGAFDSFLKDVVNIALLDTLDGIARMTSLNKSSETPAICEKVRTA
ncbi:hypothetical protein [Terasakiella pusilla]|uniref:hypothetical protein n=1 Tax=Terasakiella pusilla TaxID=64973 RepID=UPI003AA8FA90